MALWQKKVMNGFYELHFHGTANTNVLYVKDGFLQGSFIKRNGSVNKYKVTSVRLNK